MTQHRRTTVVVAALSLAGAALALAQAPATAPATRSSQTSAPATRPGVRAMQSDLILGRMLKPGAAAQPLQPLPAPPPVDATSGQGAIAPRTPRVTLTPEGTYLPSRLGRLTHARDGQAQISFESDGQAMGDPPMIILPNRMLASMEAQAKGSNTPMRFRVSGSVTEYGNRNYILIDRAVPELRQ